jgi:predicted permease
MAELFTAILPVFLLILLGSGCRLASPRFATWEHGLNQYGLYVAFPALIIHSLLKVRGSFSLDGELYLLNTVILVLLVLIPWVITKIMNTETSLANTWIICIMFGNIGYLGFPIITRMLGSDPVLTAGMIETSLALHISLYNIVLFSLGLFILEHSKGGHGGSMRILRSVGTNPLLLSVLAGVALAVFDIPLPKAVEDVINLLSNSATAVVLFGLGLFLPDVRFKRQTLGHVLALTFVSLVVVPAIFLAAAAIFQPDREFIISILEGAMPLAVSPFVLGSSYPLDKPIIAGSILVSTALSIVTIPIVLKLAL